MLHFKLDIKPPLPGSVKIQMKMVSSQCRSCRAARGLAWLGLWICTSAILTAQQVPTWSVADLEARSAEPFDNVRGARELSDGRLLVLDFGFYIVNLSKGVRAPLGRSGDGPGEYRASLRLFALPGDTTAYIDIARPRKLLFIQPSSELRGSVDIRGGSNVRDPEAADSRGRLYSQHRRTKGPPVSRDSTDIVRWDPASAKTDTVAGLMERKLVSSIRPRMNGPMPPFATYEQWAVSWDARVAAVSVEPYRVTLFHQDGTVIGGPVLPVEQLRVTEAHRRAWLEKAMEPILVIESASARPTAARRRRTESEVEPPAWPKFLPPFLPGAVSFAPDGMLWVLRTTPDPSVPLIDVINRTGGLVGRLALPKGRALLCHGKDGVYLVRVDDDGLQYIERYRLPFGYGEAVSH